jgi:hypothetical protein
MVTDKGAALRCRPTRQVALDANRCETRSSVSPVLPIGADSLAGEGRSQVWRFRHPEDGSGLVLQARPLVQRYGGDRRPAEAGRPGLAAAARPAGLPPEGARHGRRPGVGQQPHQLPRSGPGGGTRLSHAFLLDDLASPASVRAIRPALGVPKARP